MNYYETSKLILFLLLLLQTVAISVSADDAIGELASIGKTRFYLPGAAGSGPYPVFIDWIAAFETKYPEVDLSVSSVGSGASQSALFGDINCEKKHIQGLCNPNNEDGVLEVSSLRGPNSPDIDQPTTLWGTGGGTFDSEAYEEHKDRGLMQLPVFGNPVLVTYSKDVTGDLGSDTSQPLNLSAEVVASIFNNTIRYWDHPLIQDANPHLTLPNERITVVVREDKSGMSQTFTQYIQYSNHETWPDEAVGKKPKWPLPNLTSSSETDTDRCEGDDICNFHADGQTGIGVSLLRRPYSIGYLELNYFNSLTQFVGQAHVSARNNPDLYEPATFTTLQATMAGLADDLDEEKDYKLNLATEPTPPGGYAISRYIYYYIKTNPQEYQNCYEAWLVYKFFQWGYTDPIAIEIASSQGQVTPPQAVTTKALNALKKISCVVAEEEEYGSEYTMGDVISASTFTPPPYRVEEEEDDLMVILVPTLVGGGLALMAGLAALYFFLKLKEKRDGAWNIDPEDLSFDDPPRVLGNGTFGEIILANYRGTQVAVKHVIPKSEASKSRTNELTSQSQTSTSHRSWLSLGTTWKHTSWIRSDDFVEEMKMLTKLRHPNIVTMMGACQMNYGSGLEPLLVLEFMHNGSLEQILWNGTVPIDGDMLLPMLRDIASGVSFLHHAKIIHGDLKSANILVDDKFRAKVSDFGFAGSKKSKTGAGTPFWMSPEILYGNETSAASDVYAFGVIVSEMYSRKHPYHDAKEDVVEILRQVMDPKINRRPTVPPLCPAEAVSIMHNCWLANPEIRPTMEEIERGLKRLNVKSVEPIADYYPCVTLVVANIYGFQAWSSERSPTAVFQLLEVVYQAFDSIADRLGVFKVDTNAGTYIAATGLPKARADHADSAVQFAHECKKKMSELCHELESSLGPSTSSLTLQVGVHTGSITAGSLSGGHSRTQLFGDTMEVAFQMASTSEDNKVHISQATAHSLAKSELSKPRKDRIHIAGKGDVQTFYASHQLDLRSSISSSHKDHVTRLVEWNSEQLLGLLENVVSSRIQRSGMIGAKGDTPKVNPSTKPEGFSTNPIDEVSDLIVMPPYIKQSGHHFNSVDLGGKVGSQMKEYVAAIAATYNRNAFHGFEHASHVSMSANKMLKRIVQQPENANLPESAGGDAAKEHHTSTFGISSDALLQFSVVFACLIHDCDHQGVSNAQLVLEGQDVAVQYNDKCVAEQNSLDIAWELLNEDRFADLRRCICPTEDEQQRFRMLMVNTVIATDISDKEFNAKRKQRWNKVFQDNDAPKDQVSDFKATIVLEYIIQASDIAHTMQHWSVYKLWNEKLFEERYMAWLDGREPKNPVEGWYEGEIGFFDFYIIPLARKLETCGVFGVSSDEYLQYSLTNREEWVSHGREVVAAMVEKYCSTATATRGAQGLERRKHVGTEEAVEC